MRPLIFLLSSPSVSAWSLASPSRSKLVRPFPLLSERQKTRSQTRLNASISFNEEAIASPNEIVLIGSKSTLSASVQDSESNLMPLLCTQDEAQYVPFKSTLSSIKGKSGKASTFLPDRDSTVGHRRCTFIALPDAVSRNNHPLSPHTVTESLKGINSEKVQIYVVDENIEKFMGPLAGAVARAFPIYNRKSQRKNKEMDVSVSFLNTDFQTVASSSGDGKALWESARAASEGVRLAAWIGDMPPAELTVERYANECKRIAEELGGCVKVEEVVGEALKDGGYGGIYGVGKGAESNPPRMVVMTYEPENVEDECEHIALVGKGIVYDTGGLSLKTKTGMCGMKHDCGGSAGVLGGFQAAVQLGLPKKITLILAIAENAIGPMAVRNDDILTMYSGKTVEINNTDAEGRLVLADCVAYATKHIKGLDVLLDMATLTGAQLICTGKKHAGILANTAAMEERIFKCGLASGDLVYPMLYCPELLKPEFASKVADLKNSVKDRGNAQSSCAGHFIEAHLDPSYEGEFVHVDMAGPGTKNERATGYGPPLVLSLLGAPGFEP